MTKHERLESYALKYNTIAEPDLSYYEEELYGLLKDKNYNMIELKKYEKEQTLTTCEEEMTRIDSEISTYFVRLKVNLAQLSELSRQLEALYDQFYDFEDLNDKIKQFNSLILYFPV